MKKLFMLFAIMMVAFSARSRVIYYDAGNTTGYVPGLHMWNSSNDAESAGSEYQKMIPVAADNGYTVYARMTTENYANGMFYKWRSSGIGNDNKLSGDITNIGDNVMYNGNTKKDVEWSIFGNLTSDNDWYDYSLTYKGNNVYETNYYNFDIAREKGFVLRIKAGNGYVYLKAGASNTITESNRTLNLSAPVNNNNCQDGKIKLNGSYKLVFNLSNPAQPTLTALKDGELDPSTPVEMDIARSWTEEKFYQDPLNLVLLPTPNVASWTVQINNGATRRFDGSDAQTIELGKGENYNTSYTVTITLTAASGYTTTKTFKYQKAIDWNKYAAKHDDNDSWYFYGDMNFWSILGSEKRGNDEFIYQDRDTGKGLTIGKVYEGTGMHENNPHRNDHYASMAEMIENWRFKKVEDNTTLPSGITVKRDTTWYVFDLSLVTSVDGAHADGRLCGQFKICKGYIDADGNGEIFGKGTKDNYDDNNTVKRNTLYYANANGKGANMQLDENIYENAKIYFCPDGNIVYISSEEQRPIYLYYWNKAEDQRPAEIKINYGQQHNYNIKHDANWFKPESMEMISHGTSFVSNGVKYCSREDQGHIYRIKLPNSSEHRSPLAFTASIKSLSGKEAEREVRCADIWLIEAAPADVKFNAATCYGTMNEGPVYFTLTVPIYLNNQIVGYQDIIKDWRMDYDIEEAVWTSEKQIPAEYVSGSVVTFRTAHGETVSVDVNGQDVVYGEFVCNDNNNLEILYTHLKGTYLLNHDHQLQIQAEMFLDDEHKAINTSYTDVNYSFFVYDYKGDLVASTDEPSNAPFFEWTPAEDGWYNIKVVAENLETGEVQKQFDRYPVYASAAAQTVAANTPDKKAIGKNAAWVYFDNTKTNWSLVKVFHWGGETETGNWENSKAATRIEGTNIWKYELPAKTHSVVFRDDTGSNQTVDITTVKDDHLYTATKVNNNNKWEVSESYYQEPQEPLYKETPENPETEFFVSEFAVRSIKEDGSDADDFYVKDNATGGVWYRYHTELTITDEGTGSHEVKYQWAKFEDWVHGSSSYDDVAPIPSEMPSEGKTKYELSDHERVGWNDNSYHHCANWHPAYYRVYKTSEMDNFYSRMAKTATGTNGNHGDINYNAASRIARTIYVEPKIQRDGSMTGVGNISVDNNNDSQAPVEYYDLQGRHVRSSEMTPGVYIRRQGNTATKVLVK